MTAPSNDGQEIGSQTVKTAPLPGSLSTSIEPPWFSTIWRLTDRPRPVPPAAPVRVEKNGAKMRLRVSLVHADAGVRDDQSHPVVQPLGRDAKLAAGGHGIDGVVEEVQHHLPEGVRVHLEPGQVAVLLDDARPSPPRPGSAAARSVDRASSLRSVGIRCGGRGRANSSSERMMVRARTASARMIDASSMPRIVLGQLGQEQLGEAEDSGQGVVHLVGDGGGELTDGAELGDLDELLLDPLDFLDLVLGSGQQGPVLHGHADLVGDELGDADEAGLEDPLALRIEDVEPAQGRAGVVGEPNLQRGLQLGIEAADVHRRRWPRRRPRPLALNDVSDRSASPESARTGVRRPMNHGASGPCAATHRRTRPSIWARNAVAPAGVMAARMPMKSSLPSPSKHQSLAGAQDAGQLVGPNALDGLRRRWPVPGRLGFGPRRLAGRAGRRSASMPISHRPEAQASDGEAVAELEGIRRSPGSRAPGRAARPAPGQAGTA